jgi:hypothetical protein
VMMLVPYLRGLRFSHALLPIPPVHPQGFASRIAATNLTQHCPDSPRPVPFQRLV